MGARCPLCSSRKVFSAEHGYGCPKCGIAFTKRNIIYDDEWDPNKDEG